MDNVSLFDLFGWSLWGIPFVSYPGELTDRLYGIGLFLTIAGLPAMFLQLILALLISAAWPRRFVPKAKWFPKSRTFAVCIGLVALQILACLICALIFQRGDCHTLEELGIDDITWAYDCLAMPTRLGNTIGQALQYLGFLSFGWVWLLACAAIFEWATRNKARQA